MHSVEQSLVLGPALHDVDPGGLNTGMSQNIGQFGQIFLDMVKGPGKQVPQIVREDLLPRHIGPAAQGL